MKKHAIKILLAITLIFISTWIIDAKENEIQLAVRGDDMGCAHAVNVACIEAYKNGVMRTVEVMVPGPWFLEAVEMLNENPGLDVGVHLTLTSEWANVKWRPLTHAPSLVDENGYFFPMTWPNDNFPPEKSFLKSGYQLSEVENELRAQIETAMRLIPAVSHITAHMGTAAANEELRSLTEKIGQSYGLRLEIPNAKRFPGFGGSQTTPEEKIQALLDSLNSLQPGLWLFVDHPGLDTPEMRAIGHVGYENVASDRVGVTQAFTNEKVKALIKSKNIRLMSYRDVYALEK